MSVGVGVKVLGVLPQVWAVLAWPQPVDCVERFKAEARPQPEEVGVVTVVTGCTIVGTPEGSPDAVADCCVEEVVPLCLCL